MKKENCTTCDRDLPLNQFPRFPPDSNCTHERTTCRRCWQQWLATQVESSQWDRIACAQCGNLLGQGEIKVLATKTVYQKKTRYLDAELKATMSTDPDFRWCTSPQGCKSGQTHMGGNIFRCVQCGHKSCTECNVAWHEDETCEAYQARANGQKRGDEEAESGKLMEKMAKLCPGCSRKVEKISGCDHMTCTMCRHEFCWLCLAAQTEIRRIGNTAHKADCKHHSNNLVASWPFNMH